MTLSYQNKIVLLAGLFAAVVTFALFLAPIPQDPLFHDFADRRAWLGIPNFADVVSNAGFLLAGFGGLAAVFGPWRKSLFDRPCHAAPYVILFGAIVMVACGSAYYHLAPDNNSLVWDRLPMTIGFMALFAAVIADRIDRVVGIYIMLPVLVLAGMASVGFWDITERLGAGDLRFYAIIQFLPMVAIPLILWMFPRHRYTDTVSLIWVVAWYALAKALEVFDKWIFVQLDGALSGHSIKHVAAAVACGLLVAMIVRAAARQGGSYSTLTGYFSRLETSSR